MKIADGMKMIETGWVHKPAGFRVKYQKQTEDGMEAGYSPPLGEAPLNSDVTAWRYAWKLCEATRTDVEAGASAALYNITVVDDQDNPCRFYSTGDFETYNPKNPSESG
jgi:hypothetical protein